jgi:putative hemolysin
LEARSPLVVSLLLASLPAACASILSGASAALATLSETRKRALRDVSPPGSARALDRYLEHGPAIDTRWMLLRVVGIAWSTLLWFSVLKADGSQIAMPAALCGALLAFGIPAEVARALFSHSAEQMAPLLLRVLRPLEWLVVPVAAPLSAMRQAVKICLPADGSQPADLTGGEMEIIVKEGEKSGQIAHDEAELIQNVLDFRDLTVGELLVPRTHVNAIEITTPTSCVLERVLREEHSRYPVYDERIDNVVGILHVKNLISALNQQPNLSQIELGPLLRRPALYVTDGQSAISVLHEMRQKRQHLSIVLDEFGGMRGIVTLEDIIERIVGDIRDEHDEEDPPIITLGDEHFMVDAAISIVDLNRQLSIELPEDDAYHSLGGFLVAQVGRVPTAGASFCESGWEFTVRQADDRHVARVEISRIAPGQTQSDHPQR